MTGQKKLLRAEVMAIRSLQGIYTKRLELLRETEAELKIIQKETAERLGLTVEEFVNIPFGDDGVLMFPPKPASVSDIGQQAIESVAKQVLKETQSVKEPDTPLTEEAKATAASD